MIPKIIWQTYKIDYESLPEYIKDLCDTWSENNPDYLVNYMSDNDIRDFIKTEFDNDIVKIFDQVPVGVMRGDMFRYLIILNKGGVYADIDTVCQLPCDTWVQEDKDFIVAPEHDMNFCQWTFAANAGNNIIKSVVELMISRLSNPDYSMKNFVHYHTGPSMFTDGINKEINRLSPTFCYPDDKAFCQNLIATCQCNHGDLTRENINIDKFLLYSGNNWDIFRNGAVRHLFGSQTFKFGYNRWIEESDVINAGR